MSERVSKYGFVTSEERSHIMSQISRKNTKPEVKLRKTLWHKGVRYRIDYGKAPGRPDIAIVGHKIAIFVDGEFWHGYRWEEKKEKIKSNRDYWIKKIERNMQRDLRVNKLLAEKGWTVLRFWEKQVKKELESCVNSIISEIKA